jgi:hypothetical protein
MVEVAIGLLVSWVISKATRAAHRADGVVDHVVDAGVDRVGQLILTKLGGDPAVGQLEAEASEQGQVSDRTRKRVELAVEEAAERDQEFAVALTAAVEAAQTGGTVASTGGVAVSGGVHSTGSGTAIGVVGSIGMLNAQASDGGEVYQAARTAPLDLNTVPKVRVADGSNASIRRYLFGSRDSRERTSTLPVTIYLSDEAAHQRVQDAVEDFLASAGAEVVHRDDPVLGSWFRQMGAKLTGMARSPFARELVTTGGHALEAHVVHAKDAAVTAGLLQYLGPVITSLEPVDESVIRAGALLIVKVPGKLIVHQLTASQQLQLDHQPNLASSPHEILTALQIAANGVTTPANGFDQQSGLSSVETQLQSITPRLPQPPAIEH